MKNISCLLKETLLVSKKEFWELKYSLKKLGFLFIFMVIVLFSAYEGKGSVFLQASAVPGVMLILIAITGICQSTSESILAEKKNRMIETLLSTKLSYISIILGKILPGFLISAFLTLSCIQLYYILNITLPLINIVVVINTAFYIMIAGFVTFIVVLFIPDEKTLNYITILVLIFILLLLKALYILNLTLYMTLTTPVLIVIGLILLLASCKLLSSSRLFLEI